MRNEKRKKDIACIIYASGRREEIKIKTIDVPVISSKDDWEKVIITKNREDIEGLTKVKDIAAGAVLVTAIAAAAVGLIIFVPYLL